LGRMTINIEQQIAMYEHEADLWGDVTAGEHHAISDYYDD